MSSTDLSEPTKPTFLLGDYDLTKRLSSSKRLVYQAYDPTLQKHAVIKAFLHEKNGLKSYSNEKNALANLNHPNIIKVLETVDTATTSLDRLEKQISYICFELAENGDLFNIISEHGGMPEILARSLFHDLISAIEHMHSVGMAHLDLKLENLVFDQGFNIKIIDFDLSQPLNSKKLIGNGTPNYRAPEIQKGVCGDLTAADIYSLGIILFVLMSGIPPYDETDRGFGPEFDIYYRFLRRNNKRFWEAHQRGQTKADLFSEDFKELVNSMLAENVEDRIDIQGIKNSKWYQGSVLSKDNYQEQMSNYLKMTV